jgi:hypothetical protein
MLQTTQCLTVLSLIFILSGCGGASGPKLTHVSGKVTLGGAPVPYGSIEFVPDQTKGTKGPAGAAEIINGEFSTRKLNGRGVIAGPHLVRLTGYNEKPVASTDETKPSTSEPLFNGYTINIDSLPAEKNFEIPESARGFDLHKASDSRRKANDP